MNTAVLDSPVASAADRRAVLHRLLDDALAFGPEHGQGMASHLPMALAALDGLGAHEAQMRSFMAHYARRLERGVVPRGGAKPVDDWQRLRGRFDAFETLRASFARRLARDGADAVLREAVPALVDGSSGAAFHGPIRAAHAVEAGHAGELAAGLAYWAARWEPLPAPAPATTRIAGVTPWLDAIDARRLAVDPGWRASAPLISARMQQAALTPPYLELAGALAIRRRGAGGAAGGSGEVLRGALCGHRQLHGAAHGHGQPRAARARALAANDAVRARAGAACGGRGEPGRARGAAAARGVGVRTRLGRRAPPGLRER
jgi:hypothetical protein